MNYGDLCPNCMAGILKNGVCTACGKPPLDQKRPGDALPLGYQLRNYRLGKVLGHGGFGITYLAWDCKRDIRVAVKELAPSGAVTRDQTSGSFQVNGEKQAYFQHVKKRFREEAQTIYKLGSYEEIIRVFDLFDTLGTSYYVMEYLDGEDFRRIVSHTGKLSWEQIQRPVWDALKTLKILHNNQLIHRDISPDNIFLLKDGRTKLIDFGSVRRERAGHFTTILKQEYAPVEQFQENGNQGPWTDVFSLSASLYYMLNGGRAPVRATERFFELQYQKPDPLIPLSDFAPEAPEYVCNAVMRGLSLLPKDRMQSADEMRMAFFPESQQPSARQKAFAVCVNGLFAGQGILLPRGSEVNLGRGQNNDVSYPDNMKGVSRMQCAFFQDEEGKIFVKDRGSSFGTYIDGNRMNSEEWYRVSAGQIVSFGREYYQIRVQ